MRWVSNSMGKDNSGNKGLEMEIGALNSVDSSLQKRLAEDDDSTTKGKHLQC